MTCPECGAEFLPTSVVGFDYSFRCGQCGGWWVPGWVVNNIADGKKITAQPKGGKAKVGSDKVMCPTDKMVLLAQTGEVVPEELGAKRCSECGWWWFGGDQIFGFAEAFAAKKRYMSLWHKKEWQAYAWPALAVAITLLGAAGGVVTVRLRQQAAIRAQEGVRELRIVQTGPGGVEVRFKSTVGVGAIEYRNALNSKFEIRNLKFENGYYLTIIEGLDKGQYVVRILGKEYRFEVK